MARTRATLLSAMWSESRWTALTSAAQQTYMLVLSQPKLSLVGVIDFLPGRWATLSAGTTAADVRGTVAELADAGYVVLDEDTDELAVRWFVSDDLPQAPNVNQMKGIWSAWGAIASPVLRQMVLDELPERVWSHEKIPPPSGINPSGRAVSTGRPDDPCEQSDATSLFPLPSSLLPLPTARPEHVDDPPQAPSPEVERLQRAHDAIDVLTDRALAGAKTHTSVAGHRNAIRAGKTRDHLTALVAVAHEHPEWTAEQLADRVEPRPHQIRPGPAPPGPWQPTVVADAVPCAESARQVVDLRARLNAPAAAVR